MGHTDIQWHTDVWGVWMYKGYRHMGVYGYMGGIWMYMPANYT